MSKYNYGKVVEISKIPNNEITMALKDFAEGSPALEECLLILYKLGITTVSCCRGQHLSYEERFSNNEVESNPFVSYDSYITFQKNQNWKDYLSEELIEDKDVVIGENIIDYFGQDNESFFRKLCKAFLSGKKNNQDLLNKKNNEVTYEMHLKSYIYSLIRLRFTSNQIKELAEVFAKYTIVENEEDERNLAIQETSLLKKFLSENKILESTQKK